MERRAERIPRHYALSVLAVVAAIALRWMLDPIVGLNFPYATVFLAVLVCGWFGGVGPALVAVMLGELAANFFLLPPRFSFALRGPEDYAGLLIDTATGVAIALLGGGMKRARSAAEAHAARASAERTKLQTTLDSLTDGVITTGPDGHITAMNRAAAQLTGWDEAACLARPLTDVLRVDSAGTLIARDGTSRPVQRTQAVALSGIADGSHIHLFRDVSEQLKFDAANLELRESIALERALGAADRELQLRRVIEQAPIAIAMLDAQMRYVVTSAQWLDSFGFAGQDLIGRHHYDAFPNLEPSRKATFERCLRGAHERAEEDAIVRADGTIRRYRWEIQPWSARPGVVAGVIIYSEDVTERVNAKEALRRSEERLRLLVEAAHDYAIYMLDPEGRIVTWNAGAETLMGYSAAEAIGQHFSLFHNPEDVAGGLSQRALDAARDYGRWEDEGWRVRKDGTRLWVNGVLSRMMDGEKLVGFGKVVRDVTARRRDEELRRSVIDNAFDTIVSIDEKGTVQSFNSAGERLFGYASKEVIGQNVKILMPEPYHSEHDGYLENYHKSGQAQVIGNGRQVRGKRKDGQIFPLDLAVTEFHLDSERHYTGILRDLTERNKLEDQLRHAMKMEAVGLLAGGVAHDFNNVLFVVMGYGQLLLDRLPVGSEGRAELAEIVRAAERAADLTRQLLMFSRQQVVERQVLSLNEVAKNFQRMLDRVVGEDVHVRYECLSSPSKICMDRGHLEQILMNLVVNARDAMPRGGQLVIGTEDVVLDERYASEHLGVKAGRYVALYVRDSGMGMDEKTRSRIFEPFFTTKEKGKGTGLGLSTVFGIVQQANGSIAVKTQLNGGTEFRVYLPSTDAVADAVQARGQGMATAGTGTILLVEDEAPVRAITTRILETHGYQVWQADSAIDALARYGEFAANIDLLLTDVVMPRMSGVELVKFMRRSRPNLRVLFMSGYTDDALTRQGDVAFDGFNFVAKPMMPAVLLERVRQALGADVETAGDSLAG